MGYKWVALVVTFVFTCWTIYSMVIPGVNFLFLSTKDASVLKDKIEELISKDLLISDILPENELMVTAWDINNRSPRFFSKWSYGRFQDADLDHNLTLSEMVLASAVTPYYFRPAAIRNNSYISGDNVAMSPAMFAYYYAKELKKEEIRVVSVGATNELAEKIDASASLLEWATRLSSLAAPVKKHTQDYMTEYLQKKDGYDFYKFELDTTKDFEQELYLIHGKRVPVLLEKSHDFIYENRDGVDRLIEKLVHEKFTCEIPLVHKE
jgi:predicted acylesterase/phospholipase RssA